MQFSSMKWNVFNAQCSTFGHGYLESLPDFESEKRKAAAISALYSIQRNNRMANNNRNTVLDIHPENVIKMQTFSMFGFWRSVRIQFIVGMNAWCIMPDETRFSHS